MMFLRLNKNPALREQEERSRRMTNEQWKQVEEALLKFVLRVSEGKTTSETEIEILPEVVKVLAEIS